MTATTVDRNTQRRNGEQFAFPVKGATLIPLGVMVALAAGVAIPSDGLLAHPVVGVSEESVDNTAGADGAETVPVRKGCFHFANSAAGDLIALSDVGSVCYAADNQTVAKTDNAGARPVAGTIADVDADGVWVTFK